MVKTTWVLMFFSCLVCFKYRGVYSRVVYRASPSSFIVPVEKLAKASINELSVGMRFKVKFEGEDASERR